MMLKNMSTRDKILKVIGPTRMIALSFALVIFTGSVLLSLPMSNMPGQSISYLDSLFVATSAVCVTGLLPVAIVNQFNLFGQTVIIFLMQIGGLGLMSLLALLLTVMRRKLHYSEKRMLADSLNKNDTDDIPRFLHNIFKYTMIFEGVGVILFCIRLVPEYGLFHGIYNSIFLSVSAFCNAGIDNMTASSLAVYATDPLINLTVCGLIITGGLGFAVWFDLRKNIVKFGKNSIKKIWTSLTVHTRLVIIVTSILLASGTLLVVLFEYNNMGTLGWMSLPEKIMCGFFQSTTLRTAGFSTIDYSLLRDSTLFIMLAYMLIGGSPGGTAGGIKTTTFALMFLLIGSEVRNAEHITVFKRSIPRATFQKGFAICVMYICILFTAITILTLTDGERGFLPLAFEAFSAIATVGLSAGVTPLLSVIGKIIIISLMYIGRVGPISIILSLMRLRQNAKANSLVYPHGDVLIG